MCQSKFCEIRPALEIEKEDIYSSTPEAIESSPKLA